MAVQRDPDGIETQTLLSQVGFAGRRVLEIGSGEGRLTARLAPHSGAYFALDYDLERLQSAREAAAGNPAVCVPSVQADALALPFPAEEFDVALMAWSL